MYSLLDGHQSDSEYSNKIIEEQEKTNMTWTHHATVATIVEQNGEFLLVKEQSNGQLIINQPAGHLERNETLIEAAIRETLPPG